MTSLMLSIMNHNESFLFFSSFDFKLRLWIYLSYSFVITGHAEYLFFKIYNLV
jgi:hypothetical protein